MAIKHLTPERTVILVGTHCGLRLKSEALTLLGLRGCRAKDPHCSGGLCEKWDESNGVVEFRGAGSVDSTPEDQRICLCQAQ